jgi:cytoskeleton protein RodZ
LDPESLLAAYHKTAAQSGPVRTRIAPRASRQVRSGHLLVRLTSAGISILLAALAFLWWQGRQTDTEVERTDSSAARNTWSTTKPDTVSPPQIPDLPAETDRIVVPEADSAPEPELGTRAPQPESPSAPSATEQQQPSAVATTEDSDEASTDDNQTANPESPPLTRPRGDEEPVAREEGEAEEAPAEAREIVMRFDGPCWVDVRGSEGKYKLFGEMKKGDRHVLEGKPPYSVILGNAAAVEITIGGTAFDVSAIARGNVARFTLNPNETP